MKIKIFWIDKDISEDEFPKWINEEYGFNCKKIKSGNCSFVSNKIGCRIKFEKGIPDFFIWNKEEKYLLEFKSKLDSWRISQIEWAVRNNKLPLALALVKEDNKTEEEIEIDTDYEEMFKISNIAHRIKDIYLKDYLKYNPGIIGKEIFIEYTKDGEECYLGEIPHVVGQKWQEFDETYFKDKQKQKNLVSYYEENKLKTPKDIDVLL